MDINEHQNTDAENVMLFKVNTPNITKMFKSVTSYIVQNRILNSEITVYDSNTLILFSILTASFIP
jgi:hypothetical protein